MMFTRRLLGLAMVLPFPALAQGNSQGQGRGNQGGGPPPGRGNQGGNQGGNNAAPGGASVVIGAAELSIVRGWLGANPAFVAQPLPPGMRNRLAQGKPLPPGIARRQVHPSLLAQLPARPGYRYEQVGASIVLIQIATGLVAGMLADALLR
jgi:hypothetical protein